MDKIWNTPIIASLELSLTQLNTAGASGPAHQHNKFKDHKNYMGRTNTDSLISRQAEKRDKKTQIWTRIVEIKAKQKKNYQFQDRATDELQLSDAP